MEPNGPGESSLVPLERPAGRTQWAFSHAGRGFAVFEVAGELVVTDGACPHNGGPLAEGLVRSLAAENEGLRAGDIVLSGGLTAAVPVKAGDVVTATADRLGSVELGCV